MYVYAYIYIYIFIYCVYEFIIGLIKYAVALLAMLLQKCLEVAQEERRLQTPYFVLYRSQWPHSLRRGSATACLLELWVRIPPEAWMSVPYECCILSGVGHCFD